MLPFRPTPFFADKNRAFWNLQFIGWGGAMLMRAVTNIANGNPLSFLVLTLIATITGFSISLILSVIYGKLIKQRPLITWGVTALVLAIAVGISAFINGWTISLWRGGSGSSSSFANLVLGVFYMDMKDYVDVGGSKVIQYKDQQASHNAGTDVYADYTVTVPVNTDAKVKGVELTYQQPIGEFFGVNLNYTYADGDTDTGTPVFGTSKNTYNLTGYFENDRFSARVSWSYRDKFYAGASRATPFYQDDFGTLSASLNYKAADWLTISLDGLNLNNPKSKYYTDTSAGFLPYAIYSNGRQYYLNFRFKF